MIIRQVECDQFAGIKDSELKFDNGLNLVIGDNESGKSTIVDMIFHLLFKDTKLDGRKDLEFIDRYMPKKVEGPEGNIIDGAIVFETEKGKFKLRKEWEKGDGLCRLTLPDGTLIKGVEEVKAVLNEELKHRSGVYSEIVFASQKRQQMAIESIMRSLKKSDKDLENTKEELGSVFTQAALETGGVSLEKLEKNIEANIKSLGERWDEYADAPEGGPKRASYKNAWKTGCGLIAKAYYEADQVRSEQIEAEQTEKIAEVEKSAIKTLNNKKVEIESHREEFQKIRATIKNISSLNNLIKQLESVISQQEEAIKAWPVAIENIKKAEVLKQKSYNAMVRGIYNKAKIHRDALLVKENKLSSLKPVDSSDITKLKILSRQKQTEENKLSGMNIAASFKNLTDTPLKITSVSIGEEVQGQEERFNITEAVKIAIPGVFEMELMPQGVDIEAVKNNLLNINNEIANTHNKYQVSSLEELEELNNYYNKTISEVDQLKSKMQVALGQNTWTVIESENNKISGDVESEADAEKMIIELCGKKPLEGYKAALESQVNDYEKRFKSQEELETKNILDKSQLENYKDELASASEIPEKYRNISDPDGYDDMLKDKIKTIEGELELRRRSLSEAERKLMDKSAEEYSEELIQKEEILNAKKAEYNHWINIRNVFKRLKEENIGNPMEDIEIKFKKYLDIITDGSLKLLNMDDSMSVKLASGSYALSYDTLSEGTKDTITLAFRLAMLEHLYPEGGGLAVFDDPFTDMDPKRLSKACQLIKKFAKNNQVIFTTCDDKYRDYLGGNVIDVVS